MLSLTDKQLVKINADSKYISWLFTVITKDPRKVYSWSTKNKYYDANEYTYKINNKTFRGISLSSTHKEYGMQAPNDFNFEILNLDDALIADDFLGAVVQLRLVIHTGNATLQELVRQWDFRVVRAEKATRMIKISCVDLVQYCMEGDYPNTDLIKDLSPSDDDAKDDGLCVPLPFGTCYIPLRSLYIDDLRYYMLGPDEYNYKIYKIRSPHDWGGISEWERASYEFIQSTKTINGKKYKVFQPLVADSNNDGICNACGLWRSGNTFLDPLVQFSRSDTEKMTNPADIINYILKDWDIDWQEIDLQSIYDARDIFNSWGLVFNGAFYYKTPRAQILSTLLNMCNSTLIPKRKIKLQILSKKSQKTISKSNISKDTFEYFSLTKELSDSGHVGYQTADMPQDRFLKVVVPAKNTTEEISKEILEVPFVSDSKNAQRIGTLYYQHKFFKKSNIRFVGLGNLLALEPDDVITINHDDYGGGYDVVIDSIKINYDLSIDIDCIKYGVGLDNWLDLEPGGITIASDDSDNVWGSVTYGPSSTVSSGVAPNQIGKGFFAGNTDFWGGNPAINHEDTKIVLGDINTIPKIALGKSADLITHDGVEQGFYVDGDGNVRFGNALGYVRYIPGEQGFLEIMGTLVASEIHIPDIDTTADSFHVNKNADTWWGCTQSDFYDDNNNATAYILKDGSAKFQKISLVISQDENIIIKQGGDLIFEGGATGDSSLLRFKDETVPGEIRWEQASNPTNFWTMFKLTINDAFYLVPRGDMITPRIYIGDGNTGNLTLESGVDLNLLAGRSVRINNHLIPSEHKIVNLGASNFALNKIFVDDIISIADFYNFEGLEAIRQIKGSGEIDKKTGYELINDDTIPGWLLSQDQNGGKPYLSLKIMISLCMGAIRQLDKKIN